MTMPLSEHEENVLAEIERQLAAEDPRFASRTRRRFGVSRANKRVLAVVLGVAGVAAIVALGFLPSPWNLVVAGLGFVAVFAAILLAVTARRAASEDVPSFVPPDDRH
jgi:protein-S-isoprenylcysteine O-methyltransferase Ste14